MCEHAMRGFGGGGRECEEDEEGGGSKGGYVMWVAVDMWRWLVGCVWQSVAVCCMCGGVRLSGNDLGAEGGAAIAGALHHVPSLTTL